MDRAAGQRMYKATTLRSRWLFFCCVVIASLPVIAQDTLSVYFETGSSRIAVEESARLVAVRAMFDLAALDSVVIIGMADTVGSDRSNERLSAKRAERVKDLLSPVLPSGAPITLHHLGERAAHSMQQVRRVDAVFFFVPEERPPTLPPDSSEATSCYYVDYALLHRSHVRSIKKGKRSFTLIEVEEDDVPRRNEHRFALREKDGSFSVRPVRWTLRHTGSLWWGRQRYTTTIPEEAFKTFRVFTTTPPPCMACNEDLPRQQQLVQEDTCLQTDRFLMANLQFKRHLFSVARVKARAPLEYVDLEGSYHVGCRLYPVEWKVRKGRRKRGYVYADLPIIDHAVNNITRTMTCCAQNPEPSLCDRGIPGAPLGGRDSSVLLLAEVSDLLLRGNDMGSLSIGLGKSWNWIETALFAGIDQRPDPVYRLRTRFIIADFIFPALNPWGGWRTPDYAPTLNVFGSLYAGTELTLSHVLPDGTALLQDLHVGFARTNVNASATIPRIWVHFGVVTDHQNSSGINGDGFVRFGIDARLATLFEQW